MPLPPNFIFNQASLQDAVECRRRFQLRYLLELAWPAPVAEPADEHEAHIRSGEAFHRLIHQHQLGLPAERLSAQAEAEDEVEFKAEGRRDLAEWWRNYLASPPENLPPVRYPEVTLSAPVGGTHRLLAKYDLVAVEPDQRAVIVDWKTSARRPTGAWLAARLQTRVYRYVLVRAGGDLINAHLPPIPLPAREGAPHLPPLPAGEGGRGGEVDPAQIEMVYWFAAFPDQPERLPYNRTQHEADGHYLASLMADLAQAGDGANPGDSFPLTDDATRCRFCPYRSLCGRGVEAGDMRAEDDAGGASEAASSADWAAGFDFEQVGEIAF